MDAGALDEERIRNCSFLVMTADGPVSRCAHDARRDDCLLKPAAFDADGPRMFDPLSGTVSEATSPPRPRG